VPDIMGTLCANKGVVIDTDIVYVQSLNLCLTPSQGKSMELHFLESLNYLN